MIAALSPADINFDETLGTLRYNIMSNLYILFHASFYYIYVIKI